MSVFIFVFIYHRGVLIGTLFSFGLGAWISAGSLLNKEALVIYQVRKKSFMIKDKSSTKEASRLNESLVLKPGETHRYHQLFCPLEEILTMFKTIPLPFVGSKRLKNIHECCHGYISNFPSRNICCKFYINILPYLTCPQLSFNWYATLTILTTVVLAVPLSELFRILIPSEKEKKVDPTLLSTFIRYGIIEVALICVVNMRQ